jgi:hypothetical protein
VHHAVTDGWSQSVFVSELVAGYRRFAFGEGRPLPDLPLQYADFAVWQRAQSQTAEWHDQLAYWRGLLGGELPILDLPTDYPRVSGSSLRRGVSRAFSISPEVYAALRYLSRNEGATLFITILTAFKVLLLRYSGQEDLVVVSPVAGRNRLELEGLIGFFVNSLPLRTNLSGNPTFREALRRVKETCTRMCHTRKS